MRLLSCVSGGVVVLWLLQAAVVFPFPAGYLVSHQEDVASHLLLLLLLLLLVRRWVG
jgi:hypothetical protein